MTKMIVAVFILFTCSRTFAICNISNGDGMIRIQPTSGATSSIQFNIDCSNAFSIIFNSQNLQNNDGQSLLKHDSTTTYSKLKNTIDVKYDLSGDAGREWNKIIPQQQKVSHTYLIIARLGTVNAESLAAGDYRDRITLHIDY
jgi:hypothetical protein